MPTNRVRSGSTEQLGLTFRLACEIQCLELARCVNITGRRIPGPGGRHDRNYNQIIFILPGGAERIRDGGEGSKQFR